jgi:hypothetical protein
MYKESARIRRMKENPSKEENKFAMFLANRYVAYCSQHS